MSVGIAARSPAAGERAERGFTLVELLVTVTIMGVVMAALCTALIAGLRFGPEAGDRTQLAVDTSFLTNHLSDDIANASGPVALADENAGLAPLVYSNNCSGSFKGVFQGPWSVGPISDVIALVERAQVAQLDGTVVVYQAVLRPHDVQSKVVTVLRYDGTWSTMLTGYCIVGSNPVQSTVTASGFRWNMHLSASPGTPPGVAVIGGDRRTV